MTMHRDDFLELGQVRGVTGGEEGEGEGWRPAELGPHFFGRFACTRLVEMVQNKAGNGAIHGGAPWACGGQTSTETGLQTIVFYL